MSATTITLADQLHAMTFQPRIAGTRLGEGARRVLAAHRSKVRTAEKFVLDDEAVKLICHLSHEKERLAGWSCLARLPYDVVWFEFNLHTKVRELIEMRKLRDPLRPEEVSSVVGYLMYRDGGEGTARWIAHPFYQLDDEELVPGLIAFLFDPDGDPSRPVRGSEVWRSPTLSLRPSFPKTAITLGDQNIPADPEVLMAGLLNHKDGRIVADEWFVARGGAIVDPFWDQHLRPIGRSEVNHRIAFQVKEEAGIIRWLMTMLASINCLPKDVRPVPTSTRTRTVGAHRLSPFQHRTITLALPRDDRVVRARELLDRSVSAAPRPWHRVSGHWRVVERGKMRGRVCRHYPVMVEDDLAMCERCEMLVRWVDAYERGDMAVGVVEHTYQVTGR